MTAADKLALALIVLAAIPACVAWILWEAHLANRAWLTDDALAKFTTTRQEHS